MKLDRTKDGIRLRTSTDILRLMEKTASDLLDEKIDNDRSRAITYLCSTAGSLVKNHEMERRLDEIEKHIEGNR